MQDVRERPLQREGKSKQADTTWRSRKGMLTADMQMGAAYTTSSQETQENDPHWHQQTCMLLGTGENLWAPVGAEVLRLSVPLRALTQSPGPRRVLRPAVPGSKALSQDHVQVCGRVCGH